MIFEKCGSFTPGVGNTNIVAAPGAGLSIYVQTITHVDGGANSSVLWSDSVNGFASTVAVPNVLAGSVTFPGGLKLGANRPIQVLVGGAICRVSVTYTIGPS